jgi:hypothetical protein
MTTDSDLCVLVQSGDRDAAEELQCRHFGLVIHVAHQRYSTVPRRLWDEVRTAGRIGLHRAARTYRSELGRFAQHAGRSISNEIADMLNARNTASATLSGLVVNTGKAGRKAWPRRKVRDALAPIPDRTTAPLEILNRLSPLARVVCRLLAAGKDPVKRLGLYRGELARIRRLAFEEVA